MLVFCLSYFYVSNSPLFSPSTNVLSFPYVLSIGMAFYIGVNISQHYSDADKTVNAIARMQTTSWNVFTVCLFQANHIQMATFHFISRCNKCLWIPVFNPAINITTGALLNAIVKKYFRFETYMHVRWHYLGSRLQISILIPAWTSNHMPSKVRDQIT